MSRATYEELFALEDHHWWFRGRRAAILPHVEIALAGGARGALLDVGCGTGANLAWLLARAGPRRAVGVEPEAFALDLARGRSLAVDWVQGDAARLPVRSGSAALVLCCDVLEHVEDDGAACREMARVLAPDGTLVVTVPAGPGLWSVHDEAVGHRRRYARGELEARLTEAGFQLEACHGFNLALYPVVWAVRRWRARRRVPGREATSDFTSPPGLLQALLVAWLLVESALLRALGVRSGVSLVVRARRGGARIVAPAQYTHRTRFWRNSGHGRP